MKLRPSIVFIHGLWLHATSWSPWMAFFEQHGYATTAPGWPGEPATVREARAQPERVADRGIDDLVQHYKEVAAALPEAPILIGHSVGGLIAEKLLGEGIGRAAIAIDPAQSKGVLALPLLQLRAGLPGLGNPLNKHRSVALTREEFRFGIGNALSEAESNELFERWTIPSPVRGLFEVALANFTLHSAAKVNTDNDHRGPLLLISGTADHTVPDPTTEATFKQYRRSLAMTELRKFEGRGHSLTIDAGWRDVAEAVQSWLTAQGLDR